MIVYTPRNLGVFFIVLKKQFTIIFDKNIL